jgi:hypothetical protein
MWAGIKRRIMKIIRRDMMLNENGGLLQPESGVPWTGICNTRLSG